MVLVSLPTHICSHPWTTFEHLLQPDMRKNVNKLLRTRLFLSLLVHTCHYSECYCTTWDADPFELEVDDAGLDVPEPEEEVLDDVAVLPDDVALVGQAAVLAAGAHGADHGAAADVLQVHLDDLHQRLDVELRLAHPVVFAERVLVEHLLERQCSGVLSIHTHSA